MTKADRQSPGGLRHMHSEHVRFVITGTCHSAQNQMMMTSHILHEEITTTYRAHTTTTDVVQGWDKFTCVNLGSAYLGSLSSKSDIVGDEI